MVEQATDAHAQSKSSSRLSSLCSTQPHKRALRQTPPYVYREGNLYAGDPVSHRESLRTECMYSRLMQLRKKRNKSNKEAVLCSSTVASGLPRRRSGGSRWHPSQVCRTWLPPQTLSSPSQSLYMDMGMVMIREKGVPRDGAIGGSTGSTRRHSPSL